MATDRDTTKSTDPTLAASVTTDGAAVERRPYVAPRLRHLGSVRDLTLGASNMAGEGGMRNM